MQNKIFFLNHEHNNELMIAEAVRINAELGKDASQAIVDKLQNTINHIYISSN